MWHQREPGYESCTIEPQNDFSFVIGLHQFTCKCIGDIVLGTIRRQIDKSDNRIRRASGKATEFGERDHTGDMAGTDVASSAVWPVVTLARNNWFVPKGV